MGTVKKERNFTFSGDAVTVEELSEEDARHALNGPTGLTFEEDTTYVRITTEAGQSRVVLKEDPLLVAAVPTVPGQQRMITAGATDDTDGKDDSAKSGDSQRNQPTTEGEGSAPSGAHTPIRTQTSLASTLSTQSGATGAESDATPATPIAGAPALDNVLSNASTQSGSINRMHTTMNPSGLAGEAPSLFHQGSRHSLSAGERPSTLPAPPAETLPFDRKDSNQSGRIVLGDNASTQSQSGSAGRLSVVSPIAGALTLDSDDLQD